jgi:glutathione S-transferase
MRSDWRASCFENDYQRYKSLPIASIQVKFSQHTSPHTVHASNMASEVTPAAPAAPKAKLTLHWLNKSRSHRVLWLLEELNVEYELKTYQRQPDMRAPPELRKVHPLGKSPVLEVQGDGLEPIKIAESAAIIEYLLDHFGQSYIPKRYLEGKEGQVGAETPEWIRFRHFMHYAEGSLQPNLLLSLVMDRK